ncbi:IclR family transcriptional regulator [Gordonia sp. DT218]|uniref:IclR family transcriptional regulator n=1 Tax=Gordonia sp. DT218 TaxID=3416659 RepID=UPI003CFA6B09
MRSRDSSLIGILERVDVILEVVAIEGPVTLSEITRLTELPRTTVHRLLEQMIQQRWLLRIGNDYELGVRPFELGAVARQGHWFHRLVHPHLEELRARTRLLVHLAFLDGDSTIWWDRIGEVPISLVPTGIGARTPAHRTASGKALLSAEEDEFLDQHFPEQLAQVTAGTCNTREELSAQVHEVRNMGLAFDHGENVAELGCIAAPILVRQSPTSDGHHTAASVSVCGPLERLDNDRRLSAALFTCIAGVQRDLARSPVAIDD